MKSGLGAGVLLARVAMSYRKAKHNGIVCLGYGICP